MMDFRQRLETSLHHANSALQAAGLRLQGSQERTYADDLRTFEAVLVHQQSGVTLTIAVNLKQGSLTTLCRGAGSEFELRDFLYAQGQKAEYVARFFRQPVETYVENLLPLLAGALAPILSGQAPFSVPRDWTSYS